MELYHNSWDEMYRSPKGAVTTKTTVTLKLDAWEISDEAEAAVRLWQGKEVMCPMAKEKCGDKTVFTALIDMPKDATLVWYTFIVKDKEREYFYENIGGKGGVGEMRDFKEDKGYQITVYDKSFEVPQWFCGRVMYQIFPDRFYGVHKNGIIEKSREDYIIHYNRYEEISHNKHPFEDGPACNDFYGGNLLGIIEKLPYIKSLGVGVIYLNPIFEGYSNHKYDTGNYKKIDPMFGTEQDFANLCKEAEKYGIKIILDGVFSHTGADSIYFNKYGYYGDAGAFKNHASPYAKWYNIEEYGSYQSWWGCSNLPNVNEMDDSYLDYILRDDDSVIKKWLRLGASGWRLDVADELPDEFIKILRKEVKSVKPDAVIIGEVWEDASNKVAYDKQREYLLGNELDSVMNYPFKDSVTGYIMGHKSAEEMDRVFKSIEENYPLQTRYSLMNLLGTHDTMRIKSLFGGLGSDCQNTLLDSGTEDLAAYRFMCAVFIQMTMPGVPSIYYGDEIGMQGGRDPYNRKPFDWRRQDINTLDAVRGLSALRNRESLMTNGYIKTLLASGEVYVYARYFKDGRDVFGNQIKESEKVIICAVNRGFEAKKVTVELSNDLLNNIKGLKDENITVLTCSGGSAYEIRTNDKGIEIEIPPVGYIGAKL